MKPLVIILLLLAAARAGAAQPEPSAALSGRLPTQRPVREPNWLLVPAAALMTWGVYELGELSDDGWTYVGAYWGAAAIAAAGVVTYQHLREPSVTLSAGLVGRRPGIFVACTF